jgi:hypothetical protein
VKKENWIWMPHPGHFCAASMCKFFLNTYVGGYVVSTVGEMLPDETCREILAESRGIKLEGRGDARCADYMKKIGWEDIGFDRKYETMVFKAQKSKTLCCPWRQLRGEDKDMEGYSDAVAAFKGHMKMCKKWAKRK